MKTGNLTSQSQQHDFPSSWTHGWFKIACSPSWDQSLFSLGPDIKDVKDAVVAKPERCKYGTTGDHLAHDGANVSRGEENEAQLRQHHSSSWAQMCLKPQVPQLHDSLFV